MKRSEVNASIRSATEFFNKHSWTLPPNPFWDVTDFGLGDFKKYGLTLVNLADEPEYCEKLMYVRRGQTTPAHCHGKKKEDIICRVGTVAIKVWKGHPDKASTNTTFKIQINREQQEVENGETVVLLEGERITLLPNIYHEFWAESDECIIGEVSTANDDVNDNFFVNKEVGRYTALEEDEPALVKLVSDK